ncbi:MAG: 16S rRNA (cytosine(967)-C(5))-methyltransferase RsmB [Clostridia bacterium]|nr:16S rRNA (cytosine(967)-C(5))-methyltransferase RsmB [Clostridia bacterium]
MGEARKIAWTVLNKCMAMEQFSNIALDTAIKRSSLDSAERGLLTALVYGVIEKRLTLDACIETYAQRSIKEIAPDVRNLLRMGLYQMAFLERVPDHAAVNETVSMAQKWVKGFVNAVLRAFAREGKRIPIPDKDEDPIGYLSVNYSFLPSLCEKFVAVFGMQRTEELLAAFGKQPPLTLRVNLLKTTREELLLRLRAQGLAAEPTPMSPVGILVTSKIPVTTLSGFEEGLFFVQDEASQLCTQAVGAEPGMHVLDTCACPGSKSFAMAMDMQNTGSVTACDLHANKLSLVQSGAERLGISNLQICARDAREENSEWHKAFDRVLCDVPCSGFGVFAKKPELRYKDPLQSERLPVIQGDILRNSAGYVKPGGRLVYSTCTILPEENWWNVEQFLQENTEFDLIEQRTLYPDTDGTDGFFFAVLERRAE